jgi:hypothetical protein
MNINILPDMKATIRIVTGFLLSVFLITLISCDESFFNCLRGNGVIITEERELGEIYGVSSEGDYEVTVIIDSANKIEVEWDENLIPYISTRISGGKLIIDQGTRKCLRSNYPARIFVYTPNINLLRLTGSGFIICDDLYTGDLKIELTGSGYLDLRNLDAEEVDAAITGSGKIILEGITEQSEFTISGSGDFEAFDLIQDICIAVISGSGNMEIYASNLLDAVISGSGNIYYQGNPRVIVHITGSGSVINSN